MSAQTASADTASPWRTAAARLLLLIRLDISKRLLGSWFGAAWLIALPLAQLALYAFVFGSIFKARVPGLDGLHYVVFLCLGMWPWLAFSDAVARGSDALAQQSDLVAKVAIAPWQLICSAALAAFALHLLGFLVVLAVLSGVGALEWQQLQGVGWALLGWSLLLPLALALAVVFALLSVFIRDVQQLLPLLLGGWMFLSPILYSIDMLPEGWRGVQAFNSPGMLAAGIRDHMLGISSAASPLAIGLGVLAWGLLATLMYRRLRPHLDEFY